MARALRVEYAAAIYHALRRWIARQLEMGYETRVSQTVREIAASQALAVVEMKKTLTNVP